MEQAIEERKQSQHAAEANQFRQTQQLARRRHGQRGDDEDDCPIPRLVRDVLDGIGGELAVQRPPSQLAHRRQAQDEHRRLQPFASENASQQVPLPILEK